MKTPGRAIAGKRTTRARRNLGESGERIARLYLQQQGYQILARNYRTRRGEMDLITQDADGLAFVEVRTRRGEACGAPEESITRAKRARLIALALQFLETHPLYGDCPWRIDLVAIQLHRNGRIERIEVIKGAVEG